MLPVINITPNNIRKIPDIIIITRICLLILLKNKEKRPINTLKIIKGIPRPREYANSRPIP
jgi:hypothetical protein